MDRCAGPAVPGAGGQHRVDPGTRPRRRQRVRAGLRPAVRLPREHPARPVRGRHRRGPRGRPDGPARPPGRSRPGARDPAGRRRSRRTAGRAVRVRQPADRRRPARRRGRGHRRTAGTLRPRRDRAHQVLRRPGDAAADSDCRRRSTSRRTDGRVAAGPTRASARELRRLGPISRLGARQRRQLPAGADPELGEHLAQVPLDGAGAEEQPRSDLRVGEPFVGELGDLPLLGGQLVARLDPALAHRSAGGQQLNPGALGEPLRPHLGEHARCAARSCSRASIRRPWRRSHSP